MGTYVEEEVTVGYKGLWARIKGERLVWFIMVIIGFTALTIVNVKALGQNTIAHMDIANQLDTQTCVLSLNEAQRQTMRVELSDIARWGGDVQRHMLINWCPWMRNGRG